MLLMLIHKLFLLKNVTVQCPQSSTAELTSSTRIVCSKCLMSNQYKASAGKPLFLEEIKSDMSGTNDSKKLEIPIPNEKCHSCPIGAICENTIKTRDNFHGLVKKNQSKQKQYEFLICPERYCCSRETVPCSAVSTCASHRRGRLCGACKRGYFISLTNNDCIHNSECTLERKIEFWLIFILASIALAFLLTFSKDIKELLKSFASKIKSNVLMKFSNGEPASTPENDEVISIQPESIEGDQISLSCIFNILVSFYQLKSLITLKNTRQNTGFIDQFFNIEFISRSRKHMQYLCPLEDITVVQRELLMGYINPLIMVLTVGLSLVVYKIFKRYSCFTGNATYFFGRFYVGYYVVLAFCYKNIAKVAFTFIHCKTVSSVSFLYINGEIECFQQWQIANLLFLIFWVAPFPIAIIFGYRRLKMRHISPWMFLMLLTFPVLSIVLLFVLILRNKKRRNIHLTQTVDERLIEIFEEPYKERFYWWEAWRLLERLIVSGITVFLSNPIHRVIYLIPIFLFFTYFHFRMNPYKKSMFILRRLDTISWLCLLINLGTNSARAVAYLYNVPDAESVNQALRVATILEQLCSPLWYLIISFVKKKLSEKFAFLSFFECF